MKDVKILDTDVVETKDDKFVELIFKPSKILHVEDLDYNRELVKIYVENTNIEIEEAENAKQALEILEDYKPNLILMDIKMPGMNGFELTKIIRKNKNFSTLPIIALTANATKEDIEKYSSVFNDYLTKPVLKNNLLGTLAKYLETQN